MFKARVLVDLCRCLPTLDAVKLSHENEFLLAMCASDASSCLIAEFDSKGDGESGL